MTAHAHFLVVETAREMAHDLYTTLMTDDVSYAQWKKQNPGASPKVLEFRYVQAAYPGLIEAARATLAQMLNGTLDQSLKEQIYEALIQDGSLIRGRTKQAPQRAKLELN